MLRAIIQNNKKEKVLVLGLIIICLALVIRGTIAYITTEGPAHNAITSGGISIEVQQADTSGEAISLSREVVPGKVMDDVVTVKNTSENDCWVRMKINKSIELAEEMKGTPDLSLVKLHFNSEKWIENDGFYYYTDIVKAGEVTEPIFTQVEFSKDMGNMYVGSVSVVEAIGQGVQVKNNGVDVLSAKGWPEIEEGIE